MEDYIVKQAFIALCAYLGAIVDGAIYGWSAPIIPKLQDTNQTPLPYIITSQQGAWVGSVLYIGIIVGPYLTSYLSNQYGRKPCLFLGAITIFVAHIFLATAVNLAMIYTGRVLVGIGSSMTFIGSLVYLGEIASTNIRGIVLTCIVPFASLGTLIIFSTAPFVSYTTACYIILTMSLAYICALFFVPESPIFYAIRGKEKEAQQVLRSLGRNDTNDIIKVLSAKQDKAETAKTAWKDLFGIKSNRRALFITISLFILQQMSGMVAVTLFATTIFGLVGSTIDPNIATIALGGTRVLSSCITPLFIERVGRKILLLISTAVCCLSLIVFGIYFLLDHAGYDVKIVGWLPMVILILFKVGYDTGFGNIPPTFAAEMFSSNSRSTGSTFVITLGWIFGFAVSTSFAYALDTIGGHYTFFVFAAACALAFLFTLLVVPETKGKTLLEIQEMLSR